MLLHNIGVSSPISAYIGYVKINVANFEVNAGWFSSAAKKKKRNSQRQFNDPILLNIFYKDSQVDVFFLFSFCFQYLTPVSIRKGSSNTCAVHYRVK